MAEGYIRLPFAQGHHETLWSIVFPDVCDLESSQLFLAVHSEDEAGDITTRLPALMRIADTLEGISLQLSRALPGLGVLVLSEPPAQIPSRVNMFWLRLDQRGPWWNRVREARSIAIRIPLDITVSGLDLFIVPA